MTKSTGKRITRNTKPLADTKSSIYYTWVNMKQRCHNPRSASYKNYGARGIKVCDRWFNSFNAFFEDIGEKPTPRHTIERINVNGNYEPSNCRWATYAEQGTNTRSNHKGLPVGVYYNKRRKKYEAYIKIKGKSLFLGRYKELTSAVEARKSGEEQARALWLAIRT